MEDVPAMRFREGYRGDFWDWRGRRIGGVVGLGGVVGMGRDGERGRGRGGGGR